MPLHHEIFLLEATMKHFNPHLTRIFLELTAEFNPFLLEDILHFWNLGSGRTCCYVSSTICEELIRLMADNVSQGSSVSVVSDCELDIWDSIPRRRKGFSSRLCIQTGWRANTASYPVGTRSPFPGGKVWPRKMLTTRPI
jgi:hypothetical protein